MAKSEVPWAVVAHEWLRQVAQKDPSVGKRLTKKKSNARLIESPNLDDAAENASRLELLESLPGGPDASFFEDRKWALERFDEKQLERLRISELEGGWAFAVKQDARLAAQRIFKGEAEVGQTSKHHVERSLEPHKIIAVGKSPNKLEVRLNLNKLLALHYRRFREPAFEISNVEVYCGIGK